MKKKKPLRSLIKIILNFFIDFQKESVYNSICVSWLCVVEGWNESGRGTGGLLLLARSESTITQTFARHLMRFAWLAPAWNCIVDHVHFGSWLDAWVAVLERHETRFTFCVLADRVEWFLERETPIGNLLCYWMFNRNEMAVWLMINDWLYAILLWSKLNHAIYTRLIDWFN